MPLPASPSGAVAGGQGVGARGVCPGPFLPLGGVQEALQPPSITSELPVTDVAAGEQR
jgi:hypothetical protein